MMVNGAVDGGRWTVRGTSGLNGSRIQPNMCFSFLSTRLYSLGIPETVKLKIAVKSKEMSKRGQVLGPRP